MSQIMSQLDAAPRPRLNIYGYNCIGKQYGAYHMDPMKAPTHQPSWYVQFLDNEIVEGNNYRYGPNNSISSGDSYIGVFGWAPRKNCSWMSRSRN